MARQVNVPLLAVVVMVVAALTICVANADENVDAGSQGRAGRSSRFLTADSGGRGVARNTVNFCKDNCKDPKAKKPLCCTYSPYPYLTYSKCVDVGKDDKENCGACGKLCSEGSFCCNGACMSEYNYDNNNCGECGKKCKYGVPCQRGMCGYGGHY